MNTKTAEQLPEKAPLSAAEQFLNAQGIDFGKTADGTIIVPGDINLNNINLVELPDLSAVKVMGSFYCGNCTLFSLKGCPKYVGKDFTCNNNQLTSLEGGPEYVGGDYFCDNNHLVTLKGCPQVIKKSFSCSDNPSLRDLKYAPQKIGETFWCNECGLTSLKGGPASVGNSYFCSNNKLPTLEGSPEAIGGHFNCNDNPFLISLFGGPKSLQGHLSCTNNPKLGHLEHAPIHFTLIRSDFGSFRSLNDVSDEIKFSPETLAKRRREAAHRFYDRSTKLQASVPASVVLTVKKTPLRPK